MTADNAGASPLIANRTAIGPWETFDLVGNSDGSVSLRAHANNDYVTAPNAGASPLIANKTTIGPSEEFTWSQHRRQREPPLAREQPRRHRAQAAPPR